MRLWHGGFVRSRYELIADGSHPSGGGACSDEKQPRRISHAWKEPATKEQEIARIPSETVFSPMYALRSSLCGDARRATGKKSSDRRPFP